MWFGQWAGTTNTGQWWGGQQEAVIADVGARNTGGWFTEVLPRERERTRARVDRGRKQARADDVAAAAVSALLRELKGIEERTARLSAEWAARKREIEQPAPQQAPVAPPAIQPEPQSFLDGINVEYDISDVLAIDVEAPDSDLTAILAADVEGLDNGIEQALASIDVGVFDDDIESILMD